MSHTRKPDRGKRSGSNYRREITKGYKAHKPYMPEQVSLQNPKQSRARVFAVTCGLGLAVAVVLGLALLVFIGHGGNVVNASGGGSSSGVPAGYGSLNHPKGPCGNAGQASCAPADPGWFTVTSESPTAVTSAIAIWRNRDLWKPRRFSGKSCSTRPSGQAPTIPPIRSIFTKLRRRKWANSNGLRPNNRCLNP